MVQVIQNYPVGYAGDIKASTGTLQKTTEVSATATFNIETFIKEKESEGFVKRGQSLIKYDTVSYKNASGDKRLKEVKSEEIIFSDGKYTIVKYKTYDREGRSPTSKAVKEETFTTSGQRIARKDFERDSTGKELSETRSDFIKGKEKTITQPSVSTPGVGSSEVKTPLKEGTPGLIITSEKGSSIYNISQGIGKPELVATTKPIITTGKIEKVELGTGTVQITETKTTPVIQESVFIDGKGYSVAKELQSEFKVPQTGTIKTITQIPSGVVKPTSEVFGETTFVQKLRREQETLGNTPGPIAAVGAFGIGVGVTVGTVISKPQTIITGPYEFGKAIITKPFETGSEVGSQLYTNPFGFAGEQYGGYLVGKGIVKGVEIGKSAYVKVGAKEIPSSELFSKQVIEEGKKFPTTTSTQESLKQFKEADYQVITTSPQKISGNIAGEGPAAKAGLEDPGIYVAPVGEGSPAFLGTSKGQSYSFTLNPISPIRSVFKQPQATIFKTKGVELQPREVVAKPGFSATKEFFVEEGSKAGKAFITKRSEVGQGELPTIKGVQAGTTETEAVVPIGSRFEYTPKTTLGKIKGYEEYTLDPYNKRPIPVRRATLISEEGVSKVIEKPTSEFKPQKISGEQVLSESSRVYESKSSTIYPSLSKISSLSESSSISESPTVSSSSSKSEVSSYTSNLGSSTKSYITETSTSSTTKPSSQTSTSSTSSTQSLTSSSTSSTSSYPGTSSITSASTLKTPPVTTTNEYDYTPGIKPSKKRGKRVVLFVRKKGKFERKGLFDTAKEAFQKGVKETSTTARASFKTVYEGENKPFISEVLPEQFRTSKKDQFIVVQKRKYRIGTPGEKQELKQARQVKRQLI